MNLGGGGLVGNVGGVTSATSTGYVGSSTDSGHPSSENPNFAVIQELHELNYGRLDDFLVTSLRVQYQSALGLAQTYYGTPASRNYWSGCSTGGRQGLSLALSHGDAFDGYLVGAPANFNSRLQLTTLWPWWVNRAMTGDAASPAGTITTGKRNAANAAAVAACDALDGVTDGLLADPRRCKFDAHANVCGEPGAPARRTACTTVEAQADEQDLGRPAQRPRPAHLVSVQLRRERVGVLELGLRQPRRAVLGASRHQLRLAAVAAVAVRRRDASSRPPWSRPTATS